VADYFCASARIVVELDGRSHERRAAQDEERQKYLERQGLKVIRFTNDGVLANLDAVVEAIAAACTLTRPCGPTSPLRGEGLE
jgi:very-short-patch-repair endonuclease